MRSNDLMHDRAIALADCNNFFVSCERSICPDLNDRPVVVLSCNDGCVISRSNEVKQMGVKMGDPYFKIKNMLAYNGVAVRSTNMSLYQQISAKVMSRIKLYTDATEVYSIDESFFNMDIASVKEPVSYCRMIREDILENCRIPVSIGIAPTKTLAKLGTEYAKKNPETNGIFWVDKVHYKDMSFMGLFPCEDVWGIGRKTANKLALCRIKNAAEFLQKDDLWIKKIFGISVMYCAWELRGAPAYSLASDRKPPKSIMVSRSFGSPITTYEDMLDPLLCFTVSAAKQLRKSKLAASRITIYISTSRFNQEKFYANAKDTFFHEPKILDIDFIRTAEALLKDIFIAGYDYKKCSVILSGFSDTSSGIQATLFSAKQDAEEKRVKAMIAVDTINGEARSTIIKPAALFSALDEEKKWAPKSEFKSEFKKKDSPLPDGLRFQSHAEDCLPF